MTGNHLKRAQSKGDCMSFMLNFFYKFRVSVVIFQLFLKMVMGSTSDWGFIIKFLAQNLFGAYEFFFPLLALYVIAIFSDYVVWFFLF